MLYLTARRKQSFCSGLLQTAGAVIGFADVGSGGPLKAPWNLFRPDQLRKFDFEPTAQGSGLPLCVSNRRGRAEFVVARDERASSFHRALPEFAERFGMPSLHAARTIEVECTTLDAHFAGKLQSIDAIDVNVEGHDYQALEGGAQLLSSGQVKLAKIEFEVAAVWEGQGWLSDIDPLMRAHGYRMAGIDIEFARPASVQHCFHRGEPLWGKALYVPGKARWSAMLEDLRGEGASIDEAAAKAAALCVAADIPGQAFDALDDAAGSLQRLDPRAIKAQIGAVYRWARAEHGAAELVRLMRRSLGMRGARSAA